MVGSDSSLRYSDIKEFILLKDTEQLVFLPDQIVADILRYYLYTYMYMITFNFSMPKCCRKIHRICTEWPLKSYHLQRKW